MTETGHPAWEKYARSDGSFNWSLYTKDREAGKLPPNLPPPQGIVADPRKAGARLRSRCELVINPEAPDSAQRILREVRTGKRKPSLADSLKVKVVPLAVGVAVNYGLLASTDMSSVGVTSTAVGAMIFTDAATPWGSVAARQRRHERREAKPGTGSRKLKKVDPALHVTPESLSGEVLPLLARTQEARRAILTSTAHEQDLVDRTRNETALPDQEWAIAKALLSYTKASTKLGVLADGKAGTETSKAVKARKKALAVGLESITAKVQALEEYARSLKKLDEQHADLQQALKLSEGDSDLMDLLASTGADEMHLSQIKAMNDEAGMLSEAFAQTLEDARRVSLIALPEVGAA